MMPPAQPADPIRTDPIRTDESRAFAHHTMKVRVPTTTQDILSRNPHFAPAIKTALSALAEAIRDDAAIPSLPSFAPDAEAWQPALERYSGESWLNTVWFFAETYFYRQIIEAVRWWETGQDPFAPNKTEEYESAAPWELLQAALDADDPARPQLHEERLTAALHRALWGNRIDLSFAASRAHGTTVQDGDLLVEDTAAVVEQIRKGTGAIHLIADNAGTELMMDMACIDALLTDPSVTIHLHLKLHPTFVSDATPADVWLLWQMLERRGGLFAGCAGRLRAAFEARRLHLHPHLYWNSPYFLWEAPAVLLDAFQGARLVIVKGDANYRRIVGDALWPPETAFAQVLGYVPAPLVALRTLKSDPIIGLPTGLAHRLDLVDDRWRFNGRRGLIQFKP